jgi:hypothetical protein
MTAKDFEIPTDANTDNAYIVQVTATSVAYAPATTNQTITVSVTNIGPTITSSATQTTPENSAFSMTLTASESVTWSKTGGADTALFTLSGATLSLAAKDFEVPTDANTDNVYVVQVTATSVATSETASQTINVTVTDVADTLPAPGTPTIVWTSATSVTPPVFSFSAPTDPDLVVGDNVHFQRSTVSDFSTGLTDYNNTVDSAEDAANALTFSSGTWADGTWWVRARTERTGAANSAWSNTETKTLATSTLKTGLVSYWEFENTSWLDSHTTGNTLTGTAAPTSTAGQVGNALTLNGSTQYLSCTSNTSLQTGGQDFSFAFWFNRVANLDYDIVSKFAGGGGNQEYAVYVHNDGATGRYLQLSIFNAASSEDDLLNTNSGPLTTATWYFGVVTFNATTKLMTVSTNAGTRNTKTSTFTVPSTASDFSIGKATANNIFNGQIDQVGFWKKVLTTTEETALYNGGAGRTYASL